MSYNLNNVKQFKVKDIIVLIYFSIIFYYLTNFFIDAKFSLFPVLKLQIIEDN